jgi:hypothetical protein
MLSLIFPSIRRMKDLEVENKFLRGDVLRLLDRIDSSLESFQEAYKRDKKEASARIEELRKDREKKLKEIMDSGPAIGWQSYQRRNRSLSLDSSEK